jgi:uncharacterized protein YcbX
MHVAELWRYPVKSMRGEPLPAVEVLPDGLFGDRMCQVRRSGNGELLTGRTRPPLLGLAPVAGKDGMPVLDRTRWDSQAAQALVREAAGDDARLEPSGERRFDELPLSVLTDGAVAALGVDRRRLRPNIVVAGVDGLTERAWPGRTLVVGEVEIAVDHLCERCVMTTFDPDTLEQDPDVLRRINADFEATFALLCNVAKPGRIAVGDPVELL